MSDKEKPTDYGKVINLFEHPEFDPDLMEILDQDGGAPAELRFPQSVCASCTHVLRRRTGLLRKMDSPDKWTCSASYREPARNPQTGEMGYLPYGTNITSHTQAEPNERCILINPTGNCRLFSPKVST